MNTDAILDFIVDYYIWFIIGGLILLVAIIGFVADKKHLFPNDEKVRKQKKDKTKRKKEVKSDIWDLDNDTSNDDMDSGKNNITNIQEDNINGSIASSNINVSNENIVENDKTINSYSYEENSIDYDEDSYNQKQDDNIIENNTSTINNSDDYNINHVINNDLDDNYYDELKKSNNQLTGENPEDSNVDVEKIKSVVQDIDKIDDMFISDTKVENEENKDEKVDVDYKNIGDNPEQTLQVNYSQLKEMVEDIIAETQSEHYRDDINDNDEQSEFISNHNSPKANDEGIKDIPLPNLDHIAVDTIKQQDEDEDEDDVWKF